MPIRADLIRTFSHLLGQVTSVCLTAFCLSHSQDLEQDQRQKEIFLCPEIKAYFMLFSASPYWYVLLEPHPGVHAGPTRSETIQSVRQINLRQRLQTCPFKSSTKSVERRCPPAANLSEATFSGNGAQLTDKRETWKRTAHKKISYNRDSQ